VSLLPDATDEAIVDFYQTRDEQELTSAVVTRVERQKLLQQGWVGDAWVAWAYWANRPWSLWNRTMERLDALPGEYENQIRISLNYIRKAVNARVSKLTAHQPGWQVGPATADETDAQKARACESLLTYIYHHENMRAKCPEFVRWAEVTGAGVFRVEWDRLAGEPVPAHDEVTGEIVLGADGQPVMVPSGFPKITACSPMAVYFDPAASDQNLADCRWVAEVSFVSVEAAREQWPDKAAYIKPSSPSRPDPLTMETLGYTPSMQMDDIDRVVIYTYYERPSKKYPEGLFVATTDSVLLEKLEKLPLGGELPYAIMRVNPYPGHLYGQGMVEDLKPIQSMVNRQESKRLELVDLHANPKWLVERGSVSRKQFTNQPGEVIEYDRGSRRPELMQPPPLSPEHERLATQGIEHIASLSGVSEITMNGAPASMSGRMAQFQAEMEASQLSLDSGELELAMSRVGMLCLRLCHEFMPPEMTIRIIGEENRLEAVQFYRDAIRSTDVRIEPQSMQVKHPSVQREAVMMAFERGILGDPNDPEIKREARRMMEFGGDKIINGDRVPERMYQEEENYAMSLGHEAKVQPQEDHATHISSIKAFMSSVAYRMLSPDIQTRFMQHLAMHEAYKMMAANGQPWWMSYLPGDMQAQVFPQGVPAPPMPEGSAPSAPQMPVDAFGLDPADAAAMQSQDAQSLAAAAALAAQGSTPRTVQENQPLQQAAPIRTIGGQTPPTGGAGGWGVA
jgi:hypothetical protein